jgi:hypothetical protein
MALITVDTEVLLGRLRKWQDDADQVRAETAEGMGKGETASKDAYLAEGISRGLNDAGAVVAQYLLNVMEGLDPSTEA